MKKCLLGCFLLLSNLCLAQFSKTHYIPPLSNSETQAPQGQYLYISCPSLSSINFKIRAIGGATTVGTVSRDSPYRFDIGSGYNTQLLVNQGDVSTVRNNKGYIVEAEDLVYVTVRLTSTPQNNQAGGLVSKGIAALGTQFRIGAFINKDALNDPKSPYTYNHYTFASILATENNTRISFKDIKAGVVLLNNAAAGNTPADIILNNGESYVIAVEDSNSANKDGLIGAAIHSDKPIAVNCGSFAGSNGDTTNLDLGFDQIVSAERTGTEYIFIKGNGVDVIERPLIIANEDNTDVFLNGNSTAQTIQAGQYIAYSGADFSANGNLYVRTSKKVFAYQGIGGTLSQANQNMDFVPPLSCQTPKIINNIPLINEVGNKTDFIGTVCIVTEIAASLDFIINGASYSLSSLPSNIIVRGPLAVSGNTNYETYTFEGLTGNIAVFSTKQLYLSYFGSSGAATYGGFYSGFTFKPEVSFMPLITTQSNCIPNIELKVNTLSAFDNFIWYKNGVIDAGKTEANYTPTEPGYYHVSATISGCGSTLMSDEIPVSICPPDSDGDLITDAIDQDLDQDGISNCEESFGDLAMNTSNPLAGSINSNTYSNSFSGSVVTSGQATSFGSISGNSDGNIISEVPTGKNNSISYTLNFGHPISIALEYGVSPSNTDLLNSDADFMLKSPVDKTITVLNPDNQLLIDTNYDGVYESGIKEYSSFEIRFRRNGTLPLAAGTGTFSFHSYLTTSLTFSQTNLSDIAPNRAPFKLFASCIPKDTDADGMSDQLDPDSDNDGIMDRLEFRSQHPLQLSYIDLNANGIDDGFEPATTASDFDRDGIPDYYDLDSDNDGIKDSVETDINTDGTGLPNYVDLDSDDDACSDVIEAGFIDSNQDSYLGGLPIIVDARGLVTSGSAYTIPNGNYILAAPISISSQPKVAATCEFDTATISLIDNSGNSYQWQISTDGGTNFTDLNTDATYSGATTNTLTIQSVKGMMNGYQYRVKLAQTGNTCGLISDATTLVVYNLPVVKDIEITQCGTDLTGFSTFNLTVNNNLISSNSAIETFSYYTSRTGANTENATDLIGTPLAYKNTSAFNMLVWARVVNSNGCFRLAQITLQVITTQIPSSYQILMPTVCDDFLDTDGNNTVNNDKRDGIASFDLRSSKTTIETLLSSTTNYSIEFYRNQADALSEINTISDISKYRNIGYPNTQEIWVRIDSKITNDCFGLGPFIKLNVEALPLANTVLIPRQCDDNQDGILRFDTSHLEADLLKGQSYSKVSVQYLDSLNNPLQDSNGQLIYSPFPAIFSTSSQTIKAIVTNQSALGCSDETTIHFQVDDLAEAFPIPTALTSICDDETDPLNQDGIIAFDTTNFERIILGTQTGMHVKYYEADGSVLSSPLPNPFITSTQNVKVTIENPLNTDCIITTFIPFVVFPLPKIELVNSEIVCLNRPNTFIKLTAGIQDGSSPNIYSYNWTKDNSLLTNYDSTLDINSPGDYTVKVSTPSNCSRTRSIHAIASDTAHLSPATIIDLKENNSIAINASGQGYYQYSLDNIYSFQDSNLFENVSPGIHEVFVKDLNECGTVSQMVSVIGIPNFFTPNGDGINDTWNVEGLSTAFNYHTTTSIFDRYGKLIKQIAPTDYGWDGSFNGSSLPADDYWFVVALEDGRIVKGHFALKR